jgi:hypothetical protein
MLTARAQEWIKQHHLSQVTVSGCSLKCWKGIWKGVEILAIERIQATCPNGLQLTYPELQIRTPAGWSTNEGIFQWIRNPELQVEFCVAHGEFWF